MLNYKSYLLKSMAFLRSLKYKKISFIIFFVSLLSSLILYFTFPYNILKELILSELNTKMAPAGLYVEAKELKPYWFHGVSLHHVKVFHLDPENQNSLILEHVSIHINPVHFLFGDFPIAIELIGSNKGSLSFSGTIPFSALFKKEPYVEKTTIVLENFNMGDMLEKAIPFLFASPTEEHALLRPVFIKTDLSLPMTGKIDASYSDNQNKLEKLFVDVHFNGGYVDINNQSLDIPKQNVSPDSRIFMTKENNVLNIKQGTLFKTQDIFIQATGGITEQDEVSQFSDNTEVQIQLAELLEKNYGFLLTKMLHCNGELETGKVTRLKLSGTVNSPNCQILVNH